MDLTTLLTVTLKEVFLPLYLTVIFWVPALLSLVGVQVKPLDIVALLPPLYLTVSFRPLVESLLPTLYLSLDGLDLIEIEVTVLLAANASLPVRKPSGANMQSIAAIMTKATSFFVAGLNLFI